jgi:virginiamycin B lyase
MMHGAGITGGSDGNIWLASVFEHEIIRISQARSIARFPTPGGQLQTITAGSDGNLWFPLLDRIGRITPAGNTTEFPLPPGSGQLASLITSGPDGNVWFADYIAAEIGRVTPAGDITIFAIPAHPGGITGGPDGNIWFTEITNKVARLRLQ